MVCQSNINRSMTTHRRMLARASEFEFPVKVVSSGVGQSIKLPGPSADRPNVFSFGTTYEEIESDLRRKDEDLYSRKGKSPTLPLWLFSLSSVRRNQSLQ